MMNAMAMGSTACSKQVVPAFQLAQGHNTAFNANSNVLNQLQASSTPSLQLGLKPNAHLAGSNFNAIA
jgi:hypothetical protein